MLLALLYWHKAGCCVFYSDQSLCIDQLHYIKKETWRLWSDIKLGTVGVTTAFCKFKSQALWCRVFCVFIVSSSTCMHTGVWPITINSADIWPCSHLTVKSLINIFISCHEQMALHIKLDHYDSISGYSIFAHKLHHHILIAFLTV